MGIKGLGSLIKSAKKSVNLRKYANSKIAVDVSIFMYSYLRQPRKNALINGFWNQILTFQKHNITPIFVLDGMAPKEKIVLKKRATDRRQKKSQLEAQHKTFAMEIQQVQRKLSSNVGVQIITRGIATETRPELTITDAISASIKVEELEESILEKVGDDQELATKLVDQVKEIKEKQQQLLKSFVNNRYPTYEDKVELCQLFRLCDVPYIQSDYESDMLCSYLSKEGYVDAVVSTDLDYLTFGVENLITKFDNADSGMVTQVKLSEVLNLLDLGDGDAEDQMQLFVDMCILCGCDYTDKIKGLGPKGAQKLIKEHGALENVCEKISSDPKLAKKYVISDKFQQQAKAAKIIFKGNNDYSMDTDLIHSLVEGDDSDKMPEGERHKALEKFLRKHNINMRKKFIPMQKKINEFFVIRKDN